MRRLFIPPDWITVDKVTFPARFVHRLSKLGFTTGDHFIVLDNTGWEHEVALTMLSDEEALARVVRKTLAAGERRTKISLYQGLLRPAEFSEILRQGTWLGIVEFIPMACDRCEVPGLDAYDEAMIGEWREMIATVAEDSERGRLPQIGPALLFDAALDRVTRRGTALAVWEGDQSRDVRSLLDARPFAISLLVPPAAGFSPREMDRARQRGVIPARPPLDPLGATPVGMLIAQAIFEQLG